MENMMSRFQTNTRAVLLAGTLIAFGTAAATAWAGGDLTIRRSTIDGGGGPMSGGTFVLRGTIGQPDASLGPVSHPIGFDVAGGFWTPLLIGAPCAADLTNDGELNFFDVQAFLQAFSAQNPIADFNDDQIFDFFDVQAFLNAYSQGCP
jgi:hypothetical protein